MSDNAADVIRAHGDQALFDSLLSRNGGELGRVGQLLEHCRPYLLAIAQAELPSALYGKLGASDVVQDTLTTGFEHLDEFRGDNTEELARWLRRILLNQLANVRRSFESDKRLVSREQPPDSTICDPLQLSPSGAAAQREEEQRLAAALQRLPEDYQAVIRMRHREDRSFAEIGSALGKTEDAAGKLWARAVLRLKEELP